MEIDLLLEKAGRVVALIEIKSGSKIDRGDLRHLKAVIPDFSGAHYFCLYDGTTAYREDDIRILPWRQGVEEVVKLL